MLTREGLYPLKDNNYNKYMKKNVYKNKETGKVVVTGEKLDRKYWKKINEWKTGQMDSKKIKTK